MIVIFVGQARADLGREALIGSLAIMVSAGLYALNIIIMRRQALVADPLEITFFQSLIVTTVLLPVTAFVGMSVPPAVQWPWLLLAAMLAVTSMLLLSLGLCPRRGELSRGDRIYRLPVGDAVRLDLLRRERVAVHPGRGGADRRRLHPRRAPARRGEPET